LLGGATPFSQKLLLLEEFGLQEMPVSNVDTGTRLPIPSACNNSPGGSALDAFLEAPLSPAPTIEANEQGQNPWLARIQSCITFKTPLTKSPIEGRPGGDDFAHQRTLDFPLEYYFQSATAGARTNSGMRDGLQRHGFDEGTEFGPGGLYFNVLAGTGGPQGTNAGIKPRLHPKLPVQNANSLWTYDGTFPLKLAMVRYGHPVLFRQYNALPIKASANGGFGLNQVTTHLHNGHSPGESDGFAGAYFFPGQYYDYRWPLILSGHGRLNKDATGPKSGSPDDIGGETKIPGDWRETLSTLWFHDHRLDHTAPNVYKGMAAMMNVYSAVDRGNEKIACNHEDPQHLSNNLCFPSGSYLDWGNRDYDINMAIADKAWDANGQLYFSIFNKDGFLGDRMTVNLTWNPYLDVRPRRYRFRLLNASVSRYYKIALVNAAGKRVAFHMIANDGNIMQHAVPFPNPESQDLPLQGIGERFDIIVDFSKFAKGEKLYFVNLAEHEDGARPKQLASLSDALAGKSDDPGVGKFLEFRIADPARETDTSMNPAMYEKGGLPMMTRPEISQAELDGAKHRTFVFGRSNGTDESPWTIKTDGGRGFTADKKMKRISAVASQAGLLPEESGVEIWHLQSGEELASGGWTHPVHIHFEEGRVLKRDGKDPPLWEEGARKDIFNIGRLTSTTVDVALRFEDFVGTYVEHCHNTQHEDFAMLLRFDVREPGKLAYIRAPQPDWSGVSYADSYLLTE
jgi:FtsP/CotA-like multicopper oxidase with cupredoxin domain